MLINCPLNSDTRSHRRIGTANDEPDAVLINAARGPIVNEPALILALQEGWFRGAALNVLTQEPLPPDSPLLEMDNIILTSHSVGWTEELLRDMGREDCAGALAVFHGDPPRNVVNPDVLTRPGFIRKACNLPGETSMSSLLKTKLRGGETVLGQMVLELFTPGIASMIDRCGLEFCIYDMEHGRCDVSLAAQMINSCQGTGVVPLVRVPDLTGAPLSRLLDIGAKGIMVPRVETGAQARDIVAQTKYAPMGRRGVALGISHDRFRASDAGYFERANEDTIVIALVETALAFDNLDEILATPGIDVAWMGHYDLTVSMGIPAQFDHPRFLDAMGKLVEGCRRHGVTAGFLPPSAESAVYWIDKGFRMISLGSDISVYVNALTSFRQAVLSARS